MKRKLYKNFVNFRLPINEAINLTKINSRRRFLTVDYCQSIDFIRSLPWRLFAEISTALVLWVGIQDGGRARPCEYSAHEWGKINRNIQEAKRLCIYLMLWTEFSTSQSTTLKRRWLYSFCNYYHIQCVCNHFTALVHFATFLAHPKFYR
jgi:hypothetical protein